MINFNVPPYTGKEIEYIKDAINNKKICGDGSFTKKCNSDVIEWIRYLKKTIMPGTRFELAHSFEHRYLKPACLPFHHPGKTKITIKISVFK